MVSAKYVAQKKSSLRIVSSSGLNSLRLHTVTPIYTDDQLHMRTQDLATVFLLATTLLVGPSLSAQPAPAQAGAPARKPDVPYESSPPEVVKTMLDLAKVGPNDLVYDLGSGDGRIVIMAVKEYGARGVGIDIDPQRIAEANANARLAGTTDRVRFVEGDLFGTDFFPATVVTLFLWPNVNMQLRPLLRALKPGTRIVSYVHDLGDWRPDSVVKVKNRHGERNVYLWVIPPAGVPAGERLQ